MLQRLEKLLEDAMVKITSVARDGLKAKSVVGDLNKVFEEMFNRVGTGQAQQKGLLEGAEAEIDKLFG